MWEALSEPFRHRKPQIKDASGNTQAKETLAEGRRPKQKARDWKGTLNRIWQYLSHRRWRLILVMLMVVISSVLTLLGPYLIGRAIDRYLEGPGGRPWVLFLIGLGIVYVLNSLVSWLQNIGMITIAQETVYRMRTDLFRQLHRLPIPYFAKRQRGELMSRMTNDMDNVSNTLNSSVIQVLSSVLILTGTIVVMLLLSPLMTLLTFVVVPLMAFGMRWITRRTGVLFKERQRNLGELNGFIEETLSGQRIIKAFSQEERVIEQFAVSNERIKLSGFWAQTISGFIPKLMNALNNLSFAIIAGVGGLLAIRGTITVGIIIVFVEYSRQFTRPLNDLANQWNTLLSAIAGAERVFEVLDEEVEDQDESKAVTLEAVRGAVCFSHVFFSYNEGELTLRDISFEAKPGETIAIIGPTGAGKTTLIQLLSRFYEADSGCITIDDQDITAIKRESLRAHMAFVLQDPFLFVGTIRENIRYGRLDATDEQVEEAARLANAHSFIVRLQGGYDKVLELDGGGISQGQKQLLAIARAILADPAILVLDEATSSIDTITEIKIQEGLLRLMEGRTSFVIAHRLNTIRQADQILVLKDGALLEAGSHQKLLAQQGLYSELFKGRLL